MPMVFETLILEFFENSKRLVANETSKWNDSSKLA